MHRADNLAAFMCQVSMNSGALTVCLGLYRDSCSFTFHILIWPSSKNHTASGLLKEKALSPAPVY